VAEDVFDPYAVLDVPGDASKEAIHAAYLEAKAKYDPDHVSHLGMDLQEHFKLKAQAVERAYQMLN
jgi:preprotein translocase subunit Sec63